MRPGVECIGPLLGAWSRLGAVGRFNKNFCRAFSRLLREGVCAPVAQARASVRVMWCALVLCLLLLLGGHVHAEELPAEFNRAYHYITNEGRVFEGFVVMKQFIEGQERMGAYIAPDLYGRYAEVFTLLGGAPHFGNLTNDTGQLYQGVLRASRTFLDAANTPGGDRDTLMLAMQVRANVFKNCGQRHEGSVVLNQLFDEFIVRVPFECPSHQSNTFERIDEITQRVGLGPQSLSVTTSPTVHVWNVEDLSAQMFRDWYLIPRRVVNVKGVTRHWEAVDLWTWFRIPELFSKVPGFRSWWNSTLCSQSFILADFFDHHPEHIDGKYHLPKGYFDDDEDISLPFGTRLRMSYTTFMVFSHRGGGAGFHKDAYDQSFWNVCVHGRKKWVIFPPNLSPEEIFLVSGQFLSAPSGVMSQLDWFEKVYPRLPSWNVTWYEVDQGPGDMIYIPAGGLWHSVLSVEDTVSISYNTMNKYDYKVAINALCKRGERLKDSLKACNVLKELKPSWFNDTCCQLFVQNPNAFPVMDPFHVRFVFPGVSTSYNNDEQVKVDAGGATEVLPTA